MGRAGDRKLVRRYRGISQALDGGGDPDQRADELEAIAAEIVRRHPDAATFWYDRGMFAKWRRDWPTARLAWKAYGIELTGEGLIEADLGPGSVRLNPPLRFVGERTELDGGDPVGSRRWQEREYSVFNEIALWDRSPLPTLSATLGLAGPAALEDLDDRLGPLGFAAEDWTTNLRVRCRACSEGSPDGSAHQHPPEAPEQARTIGISGHHDRVADVLAAWAAAGPDRSVEDLRVALA